MIFQKELLQHLIFLYNELHSGLKMFDLGHVMLVNFVVNAAAAHWLFFTQGFEQDDLFWGVQVKCIILNCLTLFFFKLSMLRCLFFSESECIFELRDEMIVADEHLKKILGGIDECFLLISPKTSRNKFFMSQSTAGTINARF